ncbi:hypothetical protein F5Y19DRAFT_446564 [Xylariaceae sp. FL1651]|nr:hypothetical protein F5Y19DRAFT_446564 [Xylariaceae sp. FL1651]
MLSSTIPTSLAITLIITLGVYHVCETNLSSTLPHLSPLVAWSLHFLRRFLRPFYTRTHMPRAISKHLHSYGTQQKIPLF